MFRQKRLARAAQIRCENTRRAFHLSLQQLRQNEAAFQQAQEDFAIERTIYEHAALMCHCRAILRELRGVAHACIYNRCGYFLSAGHCPRGCLPPLAAAWHFWWGSMRSGRAGGSGTAWPLTGVALPLNALTVGTAVILGLPGVILLMVLNLL